MNENATTKTTTATTAGPQDPHARLLIRMVRTLLADQSFGSLADLTDALKFQCARLHIRITNDDISRAYALLAANQHLSGDVQRTRPRYVQPETPPPLSRGEAARLVKALLERL